MIGCAFLVLRLSATTIADVRPRINQLILYENPEKMRKHVLSLLPPKCHFRKAEELLSNTGFTCRHSVGRDGRRYLYSSLTKKKAPFVDVRWQVLVYYDEQSAVQQVKVNVTYVAP
jgi:hypothetical protein